MKSQSLPILYYLKVILQIFLFCGICLLFALLILRSFAPLPLSPDQIKINTLQHLEGLSRQIRQEQAAQRMQAIFPEGACFTLTLYGLSWTNLAKSFPEDSICSVNYPLEMHFYPGHIV